MIFITLNGLLKMQQMSIHNNSRINKKGAFNDEFDVSGAAHEVQRCYIP